MMGYMRHHAIIVTSFDEDLINEVHARAKEIFPAVSEIVPSGINGYASFFIPPDGSKEGWSESDAGNERRELFIEYLISFRYEDGSSPLDWVEVQYGDDDRVTRIVRHSDDGWNA